MSEENAGGRFIDVNGMSMYYKEAGNGIPFVLLHGGLGSSENWKGYIPAFSEHFKVVMPDSRAHGRSNNPAGKLSYTQMADDIAALIEALELDKPFVGGWSDGGQLALELGMRHTGLVRGLIVAGAWYTLTDGLTDAIKGWGFEGPGEVKIEVFEDFLETSGYGDVLKPLHHHGPDYLNALALQLSDPWMTDLDYRPNDFEKITVPTLILLGDRDGLIPVGQAVHMYNHIPNAELSIVPNAGHDLTSAKPEIFTHISMNFLIRHTKPAA